MSEITLTIDDKEVKVEQGTTVLEAARSVGIDIPTLCYAKELTGFGACRLCTVEVIRGKRSRLVASCVYPAEDGLVVKTESGPVIKGRRMLLELILTRWPWVDKELLKRYGLEKTRFEENTNFCILCGLCVRYCSEIRKSGVLGFIGRGVKRQVVIYPELATELCPTCDEGRMPCRDVCPTGVIPNDFAVAAPRFTKKLPLAFPVRTFDEDNIRDVQRDVGDI